MGKYVIWQTLKRMIAIDLNDEHGGEDSGAWENLALKIALDEPDNAWLVHFEGKPEVERLDA